MTSTAGGVMVDEGAAPDRAVQLGLNQVLLGQGSNVDPVPTTIAVPTKTTYTPTLTNVANVSASTANVTDVSQIGSGTGSLVTVSGQISATITTTLTLTTIDISLPVASNFSDTTQCSGIAAIGTGAVAAGGIVSEPTGDKARLSFTPVATGAQVIPFSFRYRVI